MNGYDLVDEELRDFFTNYRNRLLPIMVTKNHQVWKNVAKSLKSMEAKIDTDKMKFPSFLMVLTGIGDYAYR